MRVKRNRNISVYDDLIIGCIPIILSTYFLIITIVIKLITTIVIHILNPLKNCYLEKYALMTVSIFENFNLNCIDICNFTEKIKEFTCKLLCSIDCSEQ